MSAPQFQSTLEFSAVQMIAFGMMWSKFAGGIEHEIKSSITSLAISSTAIEF